jgi:hypothetical protein
MLALQLDPGMSGTLLYLRAIVMLRHPLSPRLLTVLALPNLSMAFWRLLVLNLIMLSLRAAGKGLSVPADWRVRVRVAMLGCFG